MYAGRVACCHLVSMLTEQTDRWTDGRTPDRYITLSYRREKMYYEYPTVCSVSKLDRCNLSRLVYHSGWPVLVPAAMMNFLQQTSVSRRSRFTTACWMSACKSRSMSSLHEEAYRTVTLPDRCGSKKRSYRRETRATLRISWTVVYIPTVVRIKASRSPVSPRSTFSNCHVLFCLPTRGTRLITQTQECADDVVYTHINKRTKYTASCSTSKKHAWTNWHHVRASTSITSAMVYLNDLPATAKHTAAGVTGKSQLMTRHRL